MRNLDVTTLRSFVAVAELGGVTRAAGFLNLTQSAVSMQLKRLEELLGLNLLDRSSRSVSLTASGEQLLAYARRMVTLNDEVIERLTDQKFEGEIVLGVPVDIVYPAVPQVLQMFTARYPRMKVQLVTSFTKELMDLYRRGEVDVTLTTEIGVASDGETLTTKPLQWIGAKHGNAWKQRPLRLAFGRRCIFRSGVIAALEEADIPWELAVETDSDRTIEATVSADLALHAMLEGTKPDHLEATDHGGTLPELTQQNINLYATEKGKGEVVKVLCDQLRQAYRTM